MNHFEYRDGILHAENVSLPEIAKAVGTPFYCYSTATLERHYTVFANAFSDIDALVCYAMKANSNQAVLATLARLGSGADIVSEGELRRARAAGIPAEKIMFSGVGKKPAEMDYALREDILCFNIESEPELEVLSERAVAMGKEARGIVSHKPGCGCAHPRKNSPPVRPKTNLAFRGKTRRESMPRPPNCRASR